MTQAVASTRTAVGRTFTGPEGQVTYRPNAKFLEDADGYLSAHVTFEQGDREVFEVRFSRPVSADLVLPGDVIVGYQREPYYFRKVVQVSHGGSVLRITTGATTLQDGIERAEIHARIPIGEPVDPSTAPPLHDEASEIGPAAPEEDTDRSDSREGPDDGLATTLSALGAPGATSGPDEGGRRWEKRWSFSDTPLLEWQDGVSSARVTASSDVQLAGWHSLDIRLQGSSVYFRTSVQGTYAADITIHGEAHGNYSNHQLMNIFPEDESRQALLRESIMGIPVQLSTKLFGYANLDAGADGAFSWHYARRGGVGYFIEYDRGWTNGPLDMGEPDESWEAPVLSARGRVEVKAGIRGDLSCDIGGTFDASILGGATARAGVGVYFQPYLDGISEAAVDQANASIHWNLNACLEAGVSANAALAAWLGAGWFKLDLLRLDKNWSFKLNDSCWQITEGAIASGCTPDCAGKRCGSDGCGGFCGSCGMGMLCMEQTGHCCTPNCSPGFCGDDGCGGTCPCPEGEVCGAGSTQCCRSSCTQGFCGGDDGCGGSCGCAAPLICNAQGQCAQPTCTRDCPAEYCGDDGCGGRCGCPEMQVCNAQELCEDAACVPDCPAGYCGEDGCGDWCGCPAEQVCNAQDLCEEPACVADCPVGYCGQDGCGDWCGCLAQQVCNEHQLCEDQAPGCIDDANEPDGTIAAANSLSVDMPVVATICPQDVDFWGIIVPAAYAVTFQLDYRFSSGDLDLEILHPDGNVIGAGATEEDMEQVTISSVLDTVLYARVLGQNGASGDYTLSATFPTWSCPGDDAMEDPEQELATSLTNGAAFYGIICGGDDDWFSVDLAPGDTLTFSVYAPYSANSDLELYLFDVDASTQLASSETSEDTELIIFTVPPGRGGTYWIGLVGYDGSSSEYVANVLIE